MRKNTLKKVFASLTLSAIAAVSVSAIAASAVMPLNEDGSVPAVPVKWGNAVADKSFGVSDIESAESKITLGIETKHAKPGETVTLNVTADSGEWFALGIHIAYDNDLTLNKTKFSDGIKDSELYPSAMAPTFDFTSEPIAKKGVLLAVSASANLGADGTGTIASLTFEVPETAEPGYYPVSFYIHNDEDEFQNEAGNETGSKALQAWTFNNGLVDGGIIIDAPETTTTPVATTTTAPETTTTTAAPVVTTTKGATTTKAATTTKKAATTTAAKKDSPKTGVAGVGVAAAGLVAAASAAFVLRKKED